MLSSAEIKQFKFEKAVFGGYDIETVDTIYSQVAGDYEKLEKQNIELRSKMKVLIEKVEEYRRVEEGMRQALLTAQHIAEETMDKAGADAERIISDANEKAEQITRMAEQRGLALVNQYRESIVEEQTKLREAKHECAYFIEVMTRRFREESERIASIPERMSLSLPDVSDEVSKAETITGSVEAPIEPTYEEKAAEPQQETERTGETAFTVEVSGSADA